MELRGKKVTGKPYKNGLTTNGVTSVYDDENDDSIHDDNFVRSL